MTSMLYQKSCNIISIPLNTGSVNNPYRYTILTQPESERENPF